MIHLKTLFFVVLTVICTNSASGQVNITYLKGVQRLSRSDYTDYYISCNAIGRYIQWQHNGEPLTVLGAGHAGHVVVSSRSGFEYTATLLSSQPYNQDAMLDSILVISTVDRHVQAFEVTCSSNSDSRQTMVMKRNDKIENSDDDTEIRMDYVLSNAEAVQNKNRTYIFVCGAENEQLILNIDSFQFLFNERDTVGDDRTILSEDGNTVDSQSVLVARQHPFNSTSIIFIAEDADVVVTCRFGSRRVQLYSNNRTTTSTELSSDSASLSTTSSPSVASVPTTLTIPSLTTPSEKNTPDPGPASAKTTILVTSIICGCSLFGVLVIVALSCYYYFCKKKKTGSKDFPQDIEKDEQIPKCKEPVQDYNYYCSSQLVYCSRKIITSKNARSSVVPVEVNSEGSSSQENDSERSTLEDSISDESEIASASNATPAERITAKQNHSLHTESQRIAANEYMETETKVTPFKQIDELRKDLGRSIRQECEMKGFVNCFAQAKQLELVGEQENSNQVGEYAQESWDAIKNPNMYPVYISNSPMKNSLKKKYVLLWPSDEISSVSGSVVAGNLLKEVNISEKTDPLKGHKKKTSSLVCSGIEDVAQEPLDISIEKARKGEMIISIEKDTTTSDEHDAYEETSADLAFSVCALLMVTVPIFSFWYAFIAGILVATRKLERIAMNILEVARIILLVGGTETYLWVSVDLFHQLHFIGSKFLEVQLSRGLYMSPMSSTSLWWGRATSSAAKLQESAVATEGYKDSAANSFFRLFTFG